MESKYVVFEREAREFKSYHFLIVSQISIIVHKKSRNIYAQMHTRILRKHNSRFALEHRYNPRIWNVEVLPSFQNISHFLAYGYVTFSSSLGALSDRIITTTNNNTNTGTILCKSVRNGQVYVDVIHETYTIRVRRKSLLGKNSKLRSQ